MRTFRLARILSILALVIVTLGATSASTAPPAAAQPADSTPPSVPGSSIDFSSSPAFSSLTINDSESGLASIAVTRSENADTVVPPFTNGTTANVVVTISVIDDTQYAYVSIVVTDVAGNSLSMHIGVDPIEDSIIQLKEATVTAAPDQAGADVAPSDVWGFIVSFNEDTFSCNPPLPSAFFPIGTTAVTCAWATGLSVSSTVTVLDAQIPTITVPTDITVANDSGQAGAYVSYPAPIVADNDPNLGSPVCDPASGSFFPVGTTTVNCSITDPSGNIASASFDVTVNDTEAPSLGTPANITVIATSPTGAVVNYALPAASDNAPGLTVACTPPPGSAFSVGTTAVTCTATDGSSNTASTSFTVTVIGAVDLLAQLRAETIDRVSNLTAERALVATVDQARSAAASGNSFGVYLALLKYVIQLDAYESRRMVTPAAAHQLAALTLTALDAAR